MARLRGNRALHPDGVVLDGRFRSLTWSSAGADLFDAMQEKPALVRFSRGAGVPEPIPDVLGCAIRVSDAYGPGAHQDFALASSGRRPLNRHALVPRQDFLGAFYSSVLPYRLGEDLVLLGAEVTSRQIRQPVQRLSALRSAVAGGAAFEIKLLVASPLGEWREIASVEADGLVPEAEAERLRFNPWNTGPGIRPAGFFNGLRDPAYRGSQSASPQAVTHR